MDHVLSTIVARVPADLKPFESYISQKVVAVVGTDSDQAMVEMVTDSYVFDVRGKVRGYRKLGQNATNRSSLPALAFG